LFQFRRDEYQNLIILMGLIVLVPAVWSIFLGWRPGLLIPQSDHLQLGLIYQRELIRADGDWTSLLYLTGLGGGSKVHDVAGSMPITQLMAFLHVQATTLANLQVMFIQVLFSYFCVNLTLRFTEILYHESPSYSPLLLSLLAILYAFLPVLGWRITHGHDPIVIGVFVLLCFALLLADEITAKRSAVNLVLCVLALCHVFQSTTFQLSLYSVIFGTPIILGLAFAQANQSVKTRAQWFALPTMVFLAAFLISLPKFYGMLLNGLGDESSRVAGNTVIYSYLVNTWQDWLASLTWSTGFIPASREAWMHQETNYPIGVAFLLLLLLPPKNTLIRLGAGLLTSLALALIVSMNLAPLSTIINNTLPLLDAFRVPARAILPFAVLLTITAMATLLHLMNSAPESKTYRWPFYLIAAISLLATGFGSALWNEATLIVLIIGLVALKHRLPKPALLILLASFSGAAITAFKERAYSPTTAPVSATTIASLRGGIFNQAPELAFPLNRLHTNIIFQAIGPNTGYLLDTATLTSYWFPPSRYAQLVMALENAPYRPTTSIFSNQPGALGFEVLNRLYNVGWELRQESDNFQIRRFGQPFGPAWISDNFTLHQTWSDLAENLIGNTDKRELQLLATDPKNPLNESTSNNCRIIDDANVQPSEFPYQIDLKVKGLCYLTIAMNFSEILQVKNQHGALLRTFPAYGALLGVVIEETDEMILVAPSARQLPMASFIQLLGFLLVIGLVIYSQLNRRGNR
jgi:hypothetical protein